MKIHALLNIFYIQILFTNSREKMQNEAKAVVDIYIMNRLRETRHLSVQY